MRLVACKSCHAQFDTTDIADDEFDCSCGATVRNENLTGIDAKILRCGSCGAALSKDSEECDYCNSPVIRDTRDLSLICPECYARNADDTRFCTACGVHFKPQRPRLNGVELPCPCCVTKMPAHHIGTLPVNECAGCQGLWVPKENFDVLINRAIDANRQRMAAGYQPPSTRKSGGNPTTQTVQYRRCPECNELMARRNFRKNSGVIIDRCPEHGTWLDADELEQIAGFILTGGQRTNAATARPRVPPLPTEPTTKPDRPRMSPRTREILAKRRARANQNRGAEVTKSVLGFLGKLLTTEIS